MPDRPDDRELLTKIVMAWDSDDSLDFLASMRQARRRLGLKLANAREDQEDAEVLAANGIADDQA